jgi:hypothetical protein
MERWSSIQLGQLPTGIPWCLFNRQSGCYIPHAKAHFICFIPSVYLLNSSFTVPVRDLELPVFLSFLFPSFSWHCLYLQMLSQYSRLVRLRPPLQSLLCALNVLCRLHRVHSGTATCRHVVGPGWRDENTCKSVVRGGRLIDVNA